MTTRLIGTCIAVLLCCCTMLLCAAHAADTATAQEQGDTMGSFLEDPFSTQTETTDRATSIRDPLEPYNRFMFTCNDKLYFYVLKPAAQGYRAVVPESVRSSIKLFFVNLATPVRMVNCLLQGKLTGAGVELMRCIINSTGGCLGFFDPAATCWNLTLRDEDTGQTLGVYRLGHGVYIVWPFFGPSSIRDTFGMLGDFFLDPLTYTGMPLWGRGSVRTFQAVNTTSLKIGEYEDFKAGALDPYVSLRSAYVQYRKAQVQK